MRLNRTFALVSCALFSVLAFAGAASAQSTTYNYAGPNYTTASGSYTTAMNLSGFITTSAPLAANLSNVDITPLIINAGASDGVQTFAPGNAQIIEFKASTDATGAIIAWSVTVFRTPITGTVGQPVAGYVTEFNFGTGNDTVFQDAPCLVVAGTCTVVNAGGATSTALGILPGGTGWVAAAPVPTLPEWGLILLAGLLLIAGAYRLRGVAGAGFRNRMP